MGVEVSMQLALSTPVLLLHSTQQLFSSTFTLNHTAYTFTTHSLSIPGTHYLLHSFHQQLLIHTFPLPLGYNCHYSSPHPLWFPLLHITSNNLPPSSCQQYPPNS